MDKKYILRYHLKQYEKWSYFIKIDNSGVMKDTFSTLYKDSEQIAKMTLGKAKEEAREIIKIRKKSDRNFEGVQIVNAETNVVNNVIYKLEEEISRFDLMEID
jgi:hypothetical protein